jgi:hypothetical protein
MPVAFSCVRLWGRRYIEESELELFLRAFALSDSRFIALAIGSKSSRSGLGAPRGWNELELYSCEASIVVAAPEAREIGPGPARESSRLGESEIGRSPGDENSRFSLFHLRGKVVALAYLFIRGGLVPVVVEGADELPLKLAVVNPAARPLKSIR